MRAAAVLLGLVVVLAGCSQLAGPVDDPATTAGPIEGTAPPANGTQAAEAAETPPPTTETATVTRTAAATPTATRTAIATRTATATATATPLPTATRTVTASSTRTTAATSPRTTAATSPTSRTRTTPGSGRLALASIHATNEVVVLRNTGQRRLNLGGYVVDFDDGQRYTLPSYTLRPGSRVRVHTGRGDDVRGDLYAGFFYPVINNNGDTVLIESPNGGIVAAERVGGN